MCGIVGLIGKKQVVPILLEGLKRLEYRGYDSAGFSVISNDRMVTTKSVGELRNLENKVQSCIPEGTVGIAHTRWATHGEPNERNAHPHLSCDQTIAVVHNGIIENYNHLREMLISEGHTFTSETDTEVLAHLIEKYHKDDGERPLEESVRMALYDVEGAYGIAVISTNDPDKIVVARRGSPLIIGIGDNKELFVASDAAALIAYTKQVIYLDDGEMAVLDRSGFLTMDLNRVTVTKEIQEITYELSEIEKGGYDHFMLKEIFEQPESIMNAIRGRLVTSEGTAKLGGLANFEEELKRTERMIFTACGTSWHACLIGEYIMEELAGIPVEVEYASEFRYRNPIIPDNTVVVVVSQSGETADTIAALKEAKRRGATVIGICNAVGSTIARESDGGVYIHAGPEIGVASTKAFTSQTMVLTILTLLMGRMRHISMGRGIEIINAIKHIPVQIKGILDKDGEIRSIAEMYYHHNNFLYLGRGIKYPVALEGALKLKEISYVHAEGYPAAEMKHGPIALIDENMPVVVLATKDSTYDKIISNIEEVRARKGKVIAIASEEDKDIQEHVDHVISIPSTLDFLEPILLAVPLQLLAYHIAVLRGANVDKPRNLAKSVTVE